MDQAKGMGKIKKAIKKPMIIVIILLIVLIGCVYLLNKNDKPLEHNTRSVNAKVGSLLVTVVGSGNLDYGEAIDIEVPSNIDIKEVLVDNEDVIKEGDILATLDSLSLQTEIESVKSQIIDIDKLINANKKAPETEKLQANVEGRIKKIYANKKDLAIDVYNDKGALILLSIDGKMAVDFESRESLSIEEEVDVVLEDGKSKKGLVKKTSNGEYTVTFTDNGPKVDEVVTINNKDGQTLGTGPAYINQPLSIIATHGRVRNIHVSENEKVASTKTIITLEDIPLSTNYHKLLADREELVDRLNLLLELSKTNTLISNASGVVMSVNIEDKMYTGNGSVSNVSNVSSGPSLTTSPTLDVGLGEPQNSTEEGMVLAFTLVPNDNALLLVNVDELDILAIEKGMDVEIAFDAIEDRVFRGKITEIADSAIATGGVAKYTVKVLMAKDEAIIL